jgi:predicted nucleic acid-binding Zn ribbon protein
LSPKTFRGTKHLLPPAASQPVAGNEWTRIDEISDSDTPLTPSPRRRRASSSPAFVRPLDFDEPISPSAAPKIAASSNAAIKATDANWPEIQSSIFPRIAETIKAAPLGNDMSTPSWLEKILLYDPIVLEDLTAWLNQQGLRIEIERLKPKVKTRGRKKKDAPPDVDEWEVVQHELKAWMVQKWCEDNSICCLWKEGLRGGVKARY